MKKNLLIALAVILGIVLLVAAGIYVTLSAQNLPAFLPGHMAGLAKHHYTHAVASFGLAFVCFAFAWMKSGKK